MAERMAAASIIRGLMDTSRPCITAINVFLQHLEQFPPTLDHFINRVMHFFQKLLIDFLQFPVFVFDVLYPLKIARSDTSKFLYIIPFSNVDLCKIFQGVLCNLIKAVAHHHILTRVKK